MKKEKNFNDINHFYGRVFLGLAILVIILIPIIMAIVLGVTPDFLVILKSFIPLIVFIVGGFIEVMTYSPLLGTSGTYLAFFTGNLVNLKVPCAVNARELAGVKHGSREGEIISTISVLYDIGINIRDKPFNFISYNFIFIILNIIKRIYISPINKGQRRFRYNNIHICPFFKCL